MAQNRDSGAKASQWGHETAKRIAAVIGASLPTGNSNECIYKGHRVVIKCAAPKTGSVGVTYRMLDAISFVIGAFQGDSAAFDLWSLPAADFRTAMIVTGSRGASAGKVGKVRRNTFYEKGRGIGRVKFECSEQGTVVEDNRHRRSNAGPVETQPSKTNNRIMAILGEAKRLAQEYRRLTGKPLGITGEVAEYEVARLLRVELTPARHAGYDAVEFRDGLLRRLQIKGRCLLDDSKPGQRLGSIRLDKEWDVVLMVLLNQNFDAIQIYEAQRKDVIAALTAPGSKARNERGALAVSKFKSIGKLRWPSIAS